MATVAQIIEKAYTKVNGEYEALSENGDDFKTYLNVLNQVMETWATTPYVKWQSLFDIDYTLADVVAADTFVYPIADPGSIIIGNTPFDSVYFVDGTGTIVKKYKMTDQALFDSTTVSDVCSIYADGLRLKSLSDDIIGTTIRLPAYIKPSAYTLGSQAVKIDSVQWLVTYMAAFICDASPVPFIARNADKFYKQAEIFMKTMRDNNRKRQHLTIKRAGQSVSQSFANLSQAINAGVGVGGGGSEFVDGGEF